jgi:hypothetical protein
MKFNKALTMILTLVSVSYSSLSMADDDNRYEETHANNDVVKQVRWNKNKPWRPIQDTSTAMNNPDLYAWQLFVSLNWPANTNRCAADKNKLLGDDGLTVWETWQAREEIFLDGAAKPQTWRKGCKNEFFYSLPEGDFSSLADETVRINKPAYNYIRDKGVYSLDEQERLVQQGIRDLDFPIGSQEVKAHWVKITEADKHVYHWAEVERNGETIIYGLSALHITSKDLPSWFWSTFEHIDNDERWSTTYPNGFRTWSVPSKDSAACPADDLACNKIPEGFGLEGTKWENYRLRGTQVEDVDNRGKATILTNSQIEGFLDQETMSCITCHTIAVKGVSGNPDPIGMIPGTVNDEGFFHGYIGTVNREFFVDDNGDEIPFLGLDYVWTLRNAKRED